MKKSKILAAVTALISLAALTSCNKKAASGDSASAKSVKIGIAKIVQHVALDSVEQGIVDVLNENGVNATFDLQNANGDPNTAAQIAMKYRDENVDVAVGIATPVALALANVLDEIPVVFGTVTDPLGAGLVSTLEHGERNVTGMSDAIPTEQHIALFKQLTGIKTLGYIYTTGEANSVSSLELVKKGCEQAGLALVTQAITNSSEVKQAAETIVDRVDGLYLTTDNTVFSALSALKQVFEEGKKPIFSGDVTGAQSGGCVIASGFNYYKAGRATGEMVLQILNGEKPSEIPVRFMTEPSDSDLLFDLDAAKNCGITIPQEFIEKANMIFENGVLTKK
ncbi:ABC transporter substrate-binding protein [uncultured Treponema sp.]|uniref:ABC transporter substrate-binding protein n=1 Tax=uncultured Treponema sp. TaxID=162155 RepID=UPI0025DB04D3|nr:ABC transporter substrate-binding protein [uncultured Treponema sp.]